MRVMIYLGFVWLKINIDQWPSPSIRKPINKYSKCVHRFHLKWSCLAVYLIFRVNIIDTLSDLTRMQIFAQIVSYNLTQMIHWRFVYIIHMNCIDCSARSYYQWQFTTCTHREIPFLSHSNFHHNQFQLNSTWYTLQALQTNMR